MIRLLRSLLTWGGSTRTVLGRQVGVDLREAAYIQDSKTRLNTLFHLYNRFRGSPYEGQLRAVYEKTKNIHNYLAERKRVQELEIFHLQHTDHFINTFTVILDAHQRQQVQPAAAMAAPPVPVLAAGKAPAAARTAAIPRPPQPQLNGGNLEMPPGSPGMRIPSLTAPEIQINTSARIRYYVKEPGPGGPVAKEIGLNSSTDEQADFLADITARFGISHFSYLGNALVNIPDHKGSHPTGMVPVIAWQGTAYALHLTRNRFFPVIIPENRR